MRLLMTHANEGTESHGVTVAAAVATAVNITEGSAAVAGEEHELH